MEKEPFLKIGEDVEGFKIVNPDEAPKDLTHQILWDLWDIGVKFGLPHDGGLGFQGTKIILTLHDYREIDGTTGLTVGKCREIGLMESAELLELENGMRILWDQGINVEEITSFIKEIDRFAVLEGLKVDGERKPLNGQNSQVSIETFMNNPDTVLAVFPDTDINQTLDKFENSHLLDVVDIGVLKLVCLKEKKDTIQIEYEIKMKQLAEMGITKDNICDLSDEQLLEVKKIFQ